MASDRFVGKPANVVLVPDPREASNPTLHRQCFSVNDQIDDLSTGHVRHWAVVSTEGVTPQACAQNVPKSRLFACFGLTGTTQNLQVTNVPIGPKERIPLPPPSRYGIATVRTDSEVVTPSLPVTSRRMLTSFVLGV